MSVKILTDHLRKASMDTKLKNSVIPFLDNFITNSTKITKCPSICVQVISNLGRYMREPGANDELLSLILVSATWQPIREITRVC